MATTEQTEHPGSGGLNTPGDFGANEWLVEEMYDRYRADPGSVDAAWHDFFADYRPSGLTAPPAHTSATGGTTPPSAANVAAPARPTADAARPSSVADTGATARPTGDGATPPRADVAASTRPTVATAPTVAPPETPPAEPRTAKPEPANPPVPRPKADKPAARTSDGADSATLRGAAARVVTNMTTSLAVPTATSVRAVPAKLLADNRVVINNHLRRSRGGKVSFTHIIGYAVVQAVLDHPEMNSHFAEVDGKPTLVRPEHVNLGIAIDLLNKDGSRSLVVPNIKGADELDFASFWSAYEDTIRRSRGGKLTADDFAGTTITLTNPGTIGTNHSVPRLMQGQGTIVGVGALEYPAEFSGMSEDRLVQSAVSKIMTLTSTYDHRIIQGAQSGEFLRRVHQLLLADDFYDGIFASLRIPYEPVRWLVDREFSHEGQIDKSARVIELINAYRTNGHLMADTDPLEFTVRTHPDLDITRHGLTLWDLDREFPVDGFAGEKLMRLRDILGVLRDAYCRRVGVEYMHITDPEQRRWIQKRIEVKNDAPTREQQLHILGRLNVAEAFETFLQTKYVGQKRFSLEGAETVIPLLDAVLSQAADQELDEVVVGMPHRGRLNVLANIVGKPYAKIFTEFEGNIDPGTAQGSGDVKYHLGADGTFQAPSGAKIAVSLTANPSHLEAVDPVLEGIVRAKQDVLDKGEDGFTVLPVLLHGDAAFAGQGVVAETLNLSQLRGYRTGGTVHVVVNNQVGFTTSPSASRSSLYSTDVARMIGAPIFHVNGDDPEACVRVATLAVQFRRDFKKDVVIDMVCYRRRGHNEADNPSFTQPLMYDIIDAKRSVRKLYTEALVGRGDITIEDAEAALKDFQQQLEKVFVETRNATGRPTPEPAMDDALPLHPAATAVSSEVIKRIADAYANPPDGFTVHPRLKPQIDRRVAMASNGSVDWATAELFAFGSLVLEGHAVRLSGQDSRRGTFTQRHAVLIDRHSGVEYTPLRYLAPEQAPFMAYDSLLSEFAAMGFEYGYSVARNDVLVCWEAQFGDFADGAQTIIDEFISSGEAKWGQRSALSLVLPHGYEGQGPDHSSGRPERFLQLAAENNMTVAMCSTPANYFHLLRRQGLSQVRRPLIAFTPKSLLRLKAAVSDLDEFTEGAFQPVIDDVVDPAQVRRVVMCSGKLYYDLIAGRSAAERTDVAIVRVEQLYPLPADEIVAVLNRYPDADLIWAQEEPANQGAWPFVALHLPEHLGGRPLVRASRPASASPPSARRACTSPSSEPSSPRRWASALGTPRPPDRPVRWGILGAGQIAGTVGADIAACAGSELGAVGARDGRRAEEFARKLGIPRSYGSYAELVADPELDVIYIATTHGQHHEHALLALEAGKPILVEKAFTLNARQAEDVIAQARARQLFCMEAMWMRFNPLLRRAAQLVTDGAIGDPVGVRADLSAEFPFDPSHRLYDLSVGGGALLDLGVYPVNFAWLFLGRPDESHAVGGLSPTGSDATAALQWSYRDGRFAQLACTTLGTNPLTGLVSGTDGWLTVLPRLHRPTQLIVHTSEGDEVIEDDGEGSGYGPQIVEVERCLRAGALESDIMPLDTTLEIMQVLDAARREIGVRYQADAESG